jgi:hypothetical protein
MESEKLKLIEQNLKKVEHELKNTIIRFNSLNEDLKIILINLDRINNKKTMCSTVCFD